MVSSVKEGSPAAEAGIQEGDVITKVVHNRKIQPLTSVKDFQELASQVRRAGALRPVRQAGRFVTLSKNAK